MAEMVYLQLAESVLAEKRKVLIRDVSKVVSDNLDLKNKIEKIEKKACILREAVVFYMSGPGETP